MGCHQGRLDYGFEVLSQLRYATHVDSQHRERSAAHRIRAGWVVEKAHGQSQPVDALHRRAGWDTVGRDAKADRFKVCRHQIHRVLGFSLSL